MNATIPQGKNNLILQRFLQRKDMKLNTKIVLSILVACLICTTAAVLVATRQISKQGEELLIGKSQAILSRLESVRGYVASQGGLDRTVKHVKEQHPDGTLPDNVKLDILKQVPIFASMKVGAENAAAEGYQFRVFSDEPRNPDNKGTTEELAVLNLFAKDSNLSEHIVESSDKIIVYRPVRLSESQGCMTCHGNPSTSPWGNGKDILGYQMENWSDGKLHGAFAVISSKAGIKEATMTATLNIILWAVGLTIFAVLGTYFLLKKSMHSLSHIAEKLEETGISVAQASNEISNASHDLSTSASTAAASIEQTTAATEEMSSMIKLNAGHTTEASTLAVGAQTKARNGKDEVEKLILSMDEIAKSSKKIEEIISVIDDIAFQTNLLALNAAVEAARAGEQGKGFAVVADAVRALAQRSATSAKEISQLIKESVEKIENGHKTVLASGSALTTIVEEIEKLTALNIEISTASNEQAAGVNSINMSITELDQVTQKNASAAQETAASAEILSERSKQMHSMVQELIGILDGHKNDEHTLAKTKASKPSTPSSSGNSGGPGTGSFGKSSGIKVLPFKQNKFSQNSNKHQNKENEKSVTPRGDASEQKSTNDTNEDLLPLD